MKWPTRIGVALTLALASVSAYASERDNAICCGASGCGIAEDATPVERLQAADDELNRTYSAVLKAYESLPGAIAAIRAAQRTWIQLRDRDFEATRLSWARQADIDEPGVENSRLFAGIREKTNLARADFLCTAYFDDRR